MVHRELDALDKTDALGVPPGFKVSANKCCGWAQTISARDSPGKHTVRNQAMLFECFLRAGSQASQASTLAIIGGPSLSDLFVCCLDHFPS